MGRERDFPRCVVLAGSEPWFQRETLASLLAALLPNGDPGGVVSRLDASRTEERGAVLGSAETMRGASLFADQQIVVVHNAESLPPSAPGKLSPLTKLALDAAACPVPRRLLVLCTNKPVKGRGSVSTKKMMEAGVVVVDCRALYAAPAPWERHAAPHDTELTRFLALRMKNQHGGALDLHTAHILVSRVGTSLGELDDALASLAAASSGSPVTQDQVTKAFSDRHSDSVWPFLEAILGGDEDETRRHLATLSINGLTGQDGRIELRHESMFPLVLATLYRNYRQHALAAELLASGVEHAEVVKRAGVAPFLATPFLARVRRRSARDWHACHRAFFDADEGVKSGRVPAQIALEQLASSVAGNWGPSWKGSRSL